MVCYQTHLKQQAEERRQARIAHERLWQNARRPAIVMVLDERGGHLHRRVEVAHHPDGQSFIRCEVCLYDVDVADPNTGEITVETHTWRHKIWLDTNLTGECHDAVPPARYELLIGPEPGKPKRVRVRLPRIVIRQCAVCHLPTTRPKHCSDECAAEANARRARNRYRLTVGLSPDERPRRRRERNGIS